MVRPCNWCVRRLVPVFLGLILAFPLVTPARAQGASPGLSDEAALQPAFRPRIVRTGTVALTGGGLYGSLLGSGDFAEGFDRGLGLQFSLRYRNSQEASIGLGFEAHSFNAKSDADSATTPKTLQLVITTVDYYRHFNVRSRTPRYLVIGAGISQSKQTNLNEEKVFPGDGGVVKLGGGLEYWANRSLTIDFGVRYYGVLAQSSLNHDVQVGLGFNFYTSP